MKTEIGKAEVNKTLIKSTNPFPVVGIGASAGGLDAFKRLLKAIPEDSGMAYVLVQHLDPTHESLLPELLQKVTRIPVLEISDDMKVAPNHIYIIPSNKMLIANDGVLELSPRITKKNERNLPIDIFFSSLAEVHQSHAIGVVLSGTGSDGTKGLKVIKDHGGITFAQDEQSATYEGMPNSAVQAGVVDFILLPEQIPQKVLEITAGIYKSDDDLKNLPQQDEEIFKQILSLLRLRKGTDFTYYKQTTIRRRILRRMALNKNETPAAYLTLLRENKPEQDILYQDLLIPVTSFFRDPQVFSHLCESVFPLILKNKFAATTKTEPIRVWVAGCSTGQEAYSIAICLKEFLKDTISESTSGVQIFATDLSEPAIAKARSGIYTKNELDELTPRRLQEFFTKTNGNHQINKQIRDMCVFATHNFLKDPPFGKVDFISCRNVLIYLEPYLQKKALTTFHYALNPKGFLLLGKSETISNVPELFGIAAKKDKVFSRKDVPAKYMHTATQRNEQNLHILNAGIKIENTRPDFQKTADDIILNKYTPAGVVVNEAMDIVHFRGKTSHFLEQSPGKPSHNLLQMAKMGLAFELRNILHKAKKEKEAVIKNNIPLQIEGTQQLISIEALALPDTIEPHYLILFHENSATKTGLPSRQLPSKINASSKSKRDEKDLRILQLEKELAQAREDMRSITEEQEAVNEELQSANEELLSGSEELQSLNEELETSKEELQSTNEELSVVNQEIIGLNEQLTEARNYSEAIVATVREPLLVLDANLRIKSANRSFYKTFQVNKLETEGAFIYDIGNHQWNIPALRTLLEDILPKKTKIADYEVNQKFQAIGARTMLLNAHKIAGEAGMEKFILLAIEDITERKTAADKLKATEQRFRYLVEKTPSPICILKGEEMILEVANEPVFSIWNVGKEALGKPFLEIVPEMEGQPFMGWLLDVLRTGVTHYGYEESAYFNHIEEQAAVFFNFVYQPYREDDGTISGVMVLANDVTEQVLSRKKVEFSEKRYHHLIQSSPISVYTCDKNGYIQLYNTAATELWGRTPQIGKDLWCGSLKLFNLDGSPLPLDSCPMALTLKEGRAVSGEEIIIERPDGEKRYVLPHPQPVFDETGELTGAINTLIDITEIRKTQHILKEKEDLLHSQTQDIQQLREKDLEEKVTQRTHQLSDANKSLLQKNEELGKMNKELESFSYISSHDLQEPLRKIQVFAKRILEKEEAALSENGKDYFHRMQNAANRMQTLIDDLLAYSRTNTAERKFEYLHPAKIIAEIKEGLKEEIEQKQAILEVGELEKINIIPFQFRQLIQNLVSNALKFSSTERLPRISIKSKMGKGSEFETNKLLPTGHYCHISVSDNGIGFDPLYSDQIFRIFQRLHGKEKYEGTGIGLAIVKKIVDNHNGIITATGNLNQGATFDIYLPQD